LIKNDSIVFLLLNIESTPITTKGREMESKLIHTFNMKIVEELLALPSAFLFGSRRLGVHNSTSDFDIAIKLGDAPSRIKEYYITSGRTIDNYMNVYPPNGSDNIHRITNFNGFDLLVFSDDSEYQTFKDATEYVNAITTTAQRVKSVRIAIFEEVLITFGWIRPTKPSW